MKQKLLKASKLALMSVLSCLGIKASAQTTVHVGQGSTATTSYFPIYSCYGYNYSQQIFYASELQAAGATGGPNYINKIRFQMSNTTASATWNQWVVYLGNTSSTGLSTWLPVSSLTQVFSGTIPTPTSGTWMELTLTTPFLWDGSSNLVVAVDENTPSYTCTASWLSYSATAPASGTRGILYYSDATNPDPLSPPTANYTSNSLSQVQFDVTPAAACVTPPTPGNATASNTTPCPGGTVTLGLSGASAGSGQTYSWEESASAAGPWTSISSAASGYQYTITATTPKYYRAAVACSGNTDYSQPVLVNVPVPFPGGTYTIDASLPTDISSGGSNFHSFADFAAALNCSIAGPIVVNVAPGTYAEQFALGAVGGTSATNTITINGNGAATLAYTTTNGNQRGIINLNGTDYITINGLNINGYNTSTSSYGWGVFMTNDANNNTINGCTITLDSATTSSNYAGIVVSGSATSATTTGSACDNITITNNTIIGGYYGITMLGNTGTGIIQNCNISNNIVRNFYAYGIYAGGTNNATIEANDIHRLNRTSVTTFGGVYMLTYNSNLKVLRNRIHDPATGVPSSTSTIYGIYLSASNPGAGNENLIANNVIYNMNGAGTQYGLYNSNSGYTRYYYNSIAATDAAATGSNTTYGFYQTTTPAGIELRNNTIVITRAATGNHVGIYMNSGVTGFSSNYNNVYVAAPSANYYGYSSALQATMANWQAASTQDANSANINPVYTNAATGDLTPTNALVDNLGTPVSVTVDVNGAARSATTPDIGAFEFAPPPCSGTPTPGTASGPATACANTNFNLVATGFSIGVGLSFQWEESPAGTGSWTPIANATSPSYTVTGFAASTDYHMVITCANGGGQDVTNTVAVTLNPFYNCYCTSGATNTADGEISNVTFGSLNNSSTCTSVGPGTGSVNKLYANYTTLTPTQHLQGAMVPLSVAANTCNGNYSGVVKVFIDYNQDGSFTGTGEEVYASSVVTYGPSTVVTGNVVIPATAPVGITRMRVVMMETTLASAVVPCGTYSYGETEDYLVEITAPQPCTGTPAPGTAYGPASICPNVTFSLGDSLYTNGIGITYQWEQYNTATSAWDPIANATNPFHTVTGGIAAATDYRMVVTCANGGGQDISNTVAVTPSPFYQCYCGPATGVTLNSSTTNYLTNVTIQGTTLNNTSTAGGAGNYTLYFPTTATNTTSLTQGVQYTINTMHLYTGYYTAAWIDYDQNGTFDAAEYVALTTNSTTGAATFTVPLTATPGLTGMRFRTYYTTLTSGQACTANNSYETEDYVITIDQAMACTGTPATASVNPSGGVCAGVAFTLTATGVTTGLGITYQWEQYNTATSAWDPIANATNTSYAATTGITVATDYRFVTTCANSGMAGISNTISYAINPASQCYCTPGTTNNAATDHIMNVTFAGINNTTVAGGANGYVDYTATVTPAQVTVGSSYAASMIIANGGTEYGGLWIDWDQSGTFDAAEFTSMGSGANPTVLSQSITVPATALTGTTRMRVRSKYSAALTATDPCSAYTYGETEDYMVTVSVAPSNNSAAGAMVITVGATCTGNSLSNLNATQDAGEPATSCAPSSGFRSVWYSFVAPSSGAVRVSTDFAGGTLTDTRVALFSATNVADYNTFSVISCDDNNGGVTGRSLLYASGLTAGGTYYIEVDGASASGQGTFCMEVAEMGGSMISAGGACAAGKTNAVNSAYTGWTSLVDNNGLLIANVKATTAGNAGTYNVSVNKNAGAVRQAGNIYYLDRNYTINGPATAHNVQFFFTDGELAALQGANASSTLANLNVTRQTGATCVGNFNSASGTNSVLTQAANGSANGTAWITTSTPGFSNFYIMGGSSPLVAELGNITAANAGTRNRVDWNTLTEQEGDYFEVERSTDGASFSRIGTVNGNAKASTYSFWDNAPVSGVNYYRLKMMDVSGRFAYSTVVAATMKDASVFAMEVYPNPVTDDVVTVKVYGADAKAQVSVCDVTGKVIKIVEVASNIATIDMKGMAQGVYLFKYTDGAYSQTVKVNKQ